MIWNQVEDGEVYRGHRAVKDLRYFEQGDIIELPDKGEAKDIESLRKRWQAGAHDLGIRISTRVHKRDQSMDVKIIETPY